MNKWIYVLGLVLAMVLLEGSGQAALAQRPPADLENEVLRISKDLYCPVCPGVPLDVCETQACVQWRALIREKLAAGETETQIRQYFTAQYGDRVLGAPRPEGFSLGAYILPAAALLAGVAILALTLRGWKRRPSVAPTGAPLSPEYAERLARELRGRE